ncbi:MAG: hypothetical protein U1E20_10465 [Methylocystis sp.]|uniref:hypothetical protein n=1 Tax=Methylocystis sp. TaxID=1911079 RepID=UPI003927378E
MSDGKYRREVDSRTFETIRKYVQVASEEDIAELQGNLARQAELMRRHGDDESAAFWQALADRIADAAGGLDQRASGTLPSKDAA